MSQYTPIHLYPDMKQTRTISCTLYLAILLLFSQAINAQCIWNKLGPDDSNMASNSMVKYTDIAVDAAGATYIVYSDYENAKKITVKKFSGNRWANVGLPGFSSGQVNRCAIAVNAGGFPYVVFEDVANGNKITAMTFNGNSWVNLGSAGISSGQAYYPDIAIDNSGTPYIVFRDDAIGSKATVMKFTGMNWVNVGSAGFSAGAANYTKIAITNAGVPYVVYQDVANSNYATAMRYNGTAWVPVGTAGFSAIACNYTAIAIDNSGTPYVVYQESYGPATAMKFDGTSWVLVGSRFFSSGSAIYTSIAISAAGTPYVVYNDNTVFNKATVMKFDGSNWVVVGPIGITVRGAESTEVAVDGSGQPVVVCVDYGLGSFASVLKFNGTSWTNLGSTGFSAGEASAMSLDVDTAGVPFVCFKDANDKVSVMKYTDTTWKYVGNPAFSGSTVTYANMVLDRSGNPVVAMARPSPSVWRFNGTAWVSVGVNIFSNAEAVGISLALDTLDNPYVSHCSTIQAGSGGYAWKYNGTWTSYGKFTFNQTFNSSIAVSSNGTPYILFASPGACVTKYSSYYMNVGNQNFSNGAISSMAIKIAKDDTPYVIISEVGNGNKLSVMKFNGSSWSYVGNAGISAGAAQYGSLAFGKNGTLYVAYQDMVNGGKITVKKFNGTSWINVGTAGFSFAEAANTAIALDSKDNAMVAYASGVLFSKRLRLSSSASVTAGSACVGSNMSLVATGGTSYSWQGPNSFTSTAQSPVINNVAASASGAYSVIVTNSACGTETNVVNVTVTTPGVIAVGNGTICSGQTFTIAPTGATSYSFSGGSATVAPVVSTSYNVAGTDVNGCATNTVMSQVTVNPSPVIAVNSGSICLGQTFTMNPTGALSYTYSSGSTTVSPSASTVYTVTGINANGCTTEANVSLTVHQTPPLAVNSGSICSGQTFTMIPSGALSYTYSSGSSTVSPGLSSTYSVSGTDVNGCTGSATSTVTVNSIPVLTVNSGTICANQTFTMTPSGAATYTYSSGSNTVSPTASTNYTVTGTDLHGCINSVGVTNTVVVNALPSLSATQNASVCVGSGALLNVSGANTYTWTTGANTASISVTPTITTSYTVTGTDLNNCSATQTLAVTVNQSCQDVWPGDANSDGVADNFDVLELGLHYTQTGPARAAASNAWQSYFSSNWVGNISNGKNVNHSDCNGDGTIGNDDTLAIFNNYGLTHAFKPTAPTVVNPQLSLVPDQSVVAKGNWGTSSVFLGEASSPITNINGLAFTVTFDQSLIEPNSFYIEYPVSFVNAGNHNLNFNKLYFSNGLLHTASTHTMANNVNGNGKIAVLHYKIKSTLSTDAVLNIGIVQAKKSDASGTLSPLTVGTATVDAIGTSVGMDELSSGNTIGVYPNPANASVTIHSSTLLEKVELTSVTGQIVLTENVSGNRYELDLSGVTSGVYFITVADAAQKLTRKKLVVQH